MGFKILNDDFLTIEENRKELDVYMFNNDGFNIIAILFFDDILGNWRLIGLNHNCSFNVHESTYFKNLQKLPNGTILEI